METNMGVLSRRDAVKLAGGLTIGVRVMATGEAYGQEVKKTADPQLLADPSLEKAQRNPQNFMFVEQVTSKTDDASSDLVVTSAKGSDVNVRPGTMRIFRADANRDDFTKKGGWYWRCGKAQGKSQFETAGALIMVVRQKDGTVHWYSLTPDYRC
jgi:hypothetical protein